MELCYNMMLFFILLATDSRTKRQPKSEGSVLNTGSWVDTAGEGRAGKSVVCFKNLVIIFDLETFRVPPVAIGS